MDKPKDKFQDDVSEGLGTETPAPSAPQRRRFWNAKTSGQWAALTLFCVLLATWRWRTGMLALAPTAIALYALQAAWFSLLGVAVKRDDITLPRCLNRRFPWLVCGRRQIPIATTRDVTTRGRFLGAELVMLASAEGEQPALFSSRARRLAFFEALKSRNPALKIYRAL